MNKTQKSPIPKLPDWLTAKPPHEQYFDADMMPTTKDKAVIVIVTEADGSEKVGVRQLAMPAPDSKNEHE